MATLVLKNNTAADVVITDVGVIVPASGQDTYQEASMIRKLGASRTLRSLLDAATLTANDGVGDLNAMEGKAFLTTLWSAAGEQNEPVLPTGYFEGARLAWVSVSSIKAGIAGQKSLVQSAENTGAIAWVGELTATMPGDLDTGVEQADTWYAVHVIADSTGANPVKLLFSLSATNPTLPAGYDCFRRLGWAKNDSASDFWDFTQVGNGVERRYWWRESNSDLQALSNGQATTQTVVDLSAFMPPTAQALVGLVRFETGTAGAAGDNVSFRINGSTSMTVPVGFGVVSGTKGRVPVELATDSAQSVQYKVDTGGANGNRADLIVLAWDDEL